MVFGQEVKLSSGCSVRNSGKNHKHGRYALETVKLFFVVQP